MTEVIEPMEGGALFSKSTRRKMKNTGKKILKTGAKIAVKEGAVALGTMAAGPVGGIAAGMAADFALKRLKKRPGGVMPPSVRKFVAEHGDEKIVSVELLRTPLDMVSRAPLNMVTLGQFDKAVKEAGYDSAFHLGMIVNNKYQIEKFEVINVGGIKKKSNTTSLMLREESPKTIREMFDGAESIMGKDKFTGYDARTNNCQDFIVAMLQGAGILTDRAEEFVKQDVREIFKKLPGYTSALARGVTDLAAAGNAAVYGRGANEDGVENEDMDGQEGDVLEGSGLGIKKGKKWAKKKGKKAYEATKEYVKEDLRDDAQMVARKVRRSTGKGFEYAWDKAQPIRAVIRQGADILANQLNKTNIDVLERAGASIHRYVHADAATLSRMVGKQFKVASKGLIITGKCTAVVGNVMIITGTVTGQPELVAVGVALDEAGTAIELTGNVVGDVGEGVSAAIAGDRKAALLAFAKAVEDTGRGVLDLMTGGVGTVLVDLAVAAATQDKDLAMQAAARGALIGIGKAVPGADNAAVFGSTASIANTTGATSAGASAISGSGLKRPKRERGYEMDDMDMVRGDEQSNVKRSRSIMRDVRVNPTGVHAANVEVKHAQVKIEPGMRKSEFYRRPTVRGFGANFTRTGYRDAPTGEDATGDTRSRSRSIKALPVPNYRATGFDGSINDIVENSIHRAEVNRDQKLTDLMEPVTRLVRSRTHVSAPSM